MGSNSTYSKIVGTNPHADWFLEHLGLRRRNFGRFRDVALYNDKGSYVIRVLTRNAGSGRQFKHKNEILSKHPLYLRKEIEPFDDTYLYFFFKMPTAMTNELIKGGVDLATAEASNDSYLVDNRSLNKKYEEATDENEEDDEETQAAI